MSDLINSNEIMSDLNEREQFNDCLVDNEQYCLFNGPTPQGDEIDINYNNSFINNNIFDHPNNNIDNFMDNENSAAPVPLRRREIDNLINNNNVFHDKDLNESYQNGAKNYVDNSENDDKYLNKAYFMNNDFSCFNPNFLDIERDMIFPDHDNNVDKENNIGKDIDESEIIVPFMGNAEKDYIGVERIAPFSLMNDISNNNMSKRQINLENSQSKKNIMDDPINNNLLNSSQNINTGYLSNSANSQVNQNQNSLNCSSQNQIISPNLEKSEKNLTSSDPDKCSHENISLTKGNKKKSTKNETTTNKNKKKCLRRFKPDSFRKKIKSRMHKKIRDIINKKLMKCGSKMFFDYLPQPFITNVNVMHNKAYLQLTMKTLFKMVFGNKKKDREKYKTNQKVLNYLDSNKDIRIKSGVDEFLNSTYEDIIFYYINGPLFEEDINKLYEEGESQDYIDKYKFIGEHWIEFYNNNGRISYQK